MAEYVAEAFADGKRNPTPCPGPPSNLSQLEGYCILIPDVEFSYVRKLPSSGGFVVVVIGLVIVLLLLIGLDIMFVWPSPCAPAGFGSQIAGNSDREAAKIRVNIKAKQTLYPQSPVK